MSYQNLVAWQRAMDLCNEVYRLTESFPRREMFGLTAQMRKSAFSVPSNIAEGEGRFTRGERKQFLGTARGSLYELETQLLISKRAGYSVSDDVFRSVNSVKSALDGYIHHVREA